MGKSTYAVGGRNKRTCAYDGGGGLIFATLVRTYYLNNPHNL